IGISGRHNSVTSISKTEAALPNGPAQGTIFMMLALPPISSNNKYGFIFIRLYKGKSAGIVIKNVDAPEPSRYATVAMITVPILIVMTCPCEICTILLTKGSNKDRKSVLYG